MRLVYPDVASVDDVLAIVATLGCDSAVKEQMNGRLNMSDNPYQFNKTSEDSTDAVSLLSECPKFSCAIQLEGRLEKAEALALAKRCRQLVGRDPKTGRQRRSIDGRWLIVCGLGVWLFFIARALISDIANSNFAIENSLFLIASCGIPALAALVLFVSLSRSQVKVEAGDAPIWADKEIELNSQWLSVSCKTDAGISSFVMYAWSGIAIRTSDDAWLFSFLGISPILVARKWLKSDEQQALDEFLMDLREWQTSPAAQQQMPNVFPPITEDGVRYFVTSRHQPEFAALEPIVQKLFPGTRRSTILSRPWFWKCLFLVIFASASCHPVYVLVMGEGRLRGASIFAFLFAWWLYFCIRNMKHSQVELAGVVTDSAILTETVAFRSRRLLKDIDRCERVDNALVFSQGDSIPFAMVKSSFSNDHDWDTVCQRIQAAVK